MNIGGDYLTGVDQLGKFVIRLLTVTWSSLTKILAGMVRFDDMRRLSSRWLLAVIWLLEKLLTAHDEHGQVIGDDCARQF